MTYNVAIGPIHLDVRRAPVQKLATLDNGEPSRTIRERVEAARAIQHARFAALNKPGVLVNADMGPSDVQEFCTPDPDGRAMLRMAVGRMGLRARAYHRVLKLGQTIADLAGSEQVRQAHLAEPLQHRPRGTM